MLFVAGNEEGGAACHLSPVAIHIHLALAGVNEYFMLPGVGMSGGEAARGDGENPHTKIFRIVRLADHDPAGDALYCFGVEFLAGGILVIDNLHIVVFQVKEIDVATVKGGKNFRPYPSCCHFAKKACKNNSLGSSIIDPISGIAIL
ncbi:MAG: hypothetical protein ACD_75C00657G0001 [uncultured bacterium]|nr:MAG: hypothetical protein ACD_75C00657G0001 [uncultured bacterium]